MDQIEPIINQDPLRRVPKNQSVFFVILQTVSPFLIIIVVIGSGILSGIIFSSKSKAANSTTIQSANEQNLTPEQKQSFQVVTRDQAEGVLEKNDKFEVTAQGQWKLIRPGGETQTAYLTSSFVDLDQYVGKKVKVYGETLGSDKVGWLMDIAKIEEIN